MGFSAIYAVSQKSHWKNAENDDEPIQLFSKTPGHFIYNQMDYIYKMYMYFDDSMIHLYIDKEWWPSISYGRFN